MYGTKTAADCIAMANQIRNDIATAAPLASAGDLASKVNQIAYWEGRSRAHAEYEAISDNEPAARLARLAEILAAPSDDTKSGRLNDVERSHRDGIKDAARTLITKAALAANIDF